MPSQAETTTNKQTDWAQASWGDRLRWLLWLATPAGVIYWRRKRARRADLGRIKPRLVERAPQSDRRLEEAIRFLVDRGLNESEVREGSMPAASLDYVADVVADHLPRERPLFVLHVGNFLGVSLCYFSWLAQERHPDSVVVSVDPNIPHRGIKNPQAHTLALLHHFDLLSNNLLVPGYSLERNLDEGAPTDVRDVRGLGCEQVLRSLGRLTEQRFDLVVLDGNHDGAYLSREFEALRDLLSGTAIVVFDDVSERWDGVVEVFRRALEDESTVELGQDGRVGILEVRAGSPRDLQSATPS